MKQIKKTLRTMGQSIAVAIHINPRLRTGLLVAAVVTLSTMRAFAQAGGGGGFSSTDLKTGISNSLAVIMLFGFLRCQVWSNLDAREHRRVPWRSRPPAAPFS